MMLVYSTQTYADTKFPYLNSLNLEFRKIITDFCNVDIGILLRHMFNSDIKYYLEGNSVYSNFNFREWFMYDVNNIVTISSDDPLSDKNFESLTFNSKINNFFSKIGKSYKEFNKLIKNINFNPGTLFDYFDFANEEKKIYEDTKTCLLNFINSDMCKSNNLNGMIKYSYTKNFISSVNCLCEMYNNDLVYVMVPLFEELVKIDKVILSPLNEKTFGSKQYTGTILNSINNGSYLKKESGFIKFYTSTYDKTFSDLNKGMAFDTNYNYFVPDPKDFNEINSGAITYVLNIHNVLLNLILRAFYYYKRINDLFNQTDPTCINFFEKDFNILINDPTTNLNVIPNYVETLNNSNLLKSPKMVLFSTYQKNFYLFIYNALNFYKQKISYYCYNHIKVSLAKINHDLQNSRHYSYSDPDSNNLIGSNLSIQKGQVLQKTYILFEDMLTAVKNGEAYISEVERKYNYIEEVSKQPEYSWLKPDISSTGFWSVSSNVISDLGLDYYNPIYNEIKSSIDNYFNTVFYFDNSRLYGCFDGGLSNYYSNMGTTSIVSNSPGGLKSKITNEPTLISYVNNLDTSGNISKHGAIVNCINDTVTHNQLLSNAPGRSTDKFDIVSIVPYNTKSNSTPGANLDTYSCYAGQSKIFEQNTENVIPLNVKDMDRCKINYTDDKGNVNPDFNKNLNNTSIIYKIDTTTIYDSSNVVFLGCFARNIPEMGVYNTLPHFIGTISGAEFYGNPISIINSCDKLVEKYNDDMGTNFDIFGITSNASDTLSIDCYAGTFAFDAKYSMTVKKSPYEENCNIYYPGTENFMIFQNIIFVSNPCVTPEVNKLQSYNDKLTTYLNSNIVDQQKAVQQMGADINILNNIFPIKFSVSAIANTKDSADIIIDSSTSSGFETNSNSLPICSLKIMVKEGPPGVKGDIGVSGKQGKNTKGSDGELGNMGYWGTAKN
jgi:hypothetical protein